MCKTCRENAKIKNRTPVCEGCDNAPPGNLPRIAALAIEIAQSTCWMDSFGGINQQAIYSAITFYSFDTIKHYLNDLILSFCSGVLTEKNAKE